MALAFIAGVFVGALLILALMIRNAIKAADYTSPGRKRGFSL